MPANKSFSYFIFFFIANASVVPGCCRGSGGILRFSSDALGTARKVFFAYKYFIFVYKQLLDMEISFL